MHPSPFNGRLQNHSAVPLLFRQLDAPLSSPSPSGGWARLPPHSCCLLLPDGEEGATQLGLLAVTACAAERAMPPPGEAPPPAEAQASGEVPLDASCSVSLNLASLAAGAVHRMPFKPTGPSPCSPSSSSTPSSSLPVAFLLVTAGERNGQRVIRVTEEDRAVRHGQAGGTAGEHGMEPSPFSPLSSPHALPGAGTVGFVPRHGSGEDVRGSSSSSFRVSVHAVGLGVSVIDQQPQEIIYASLDGVAVDYSHESRPQKKKSR